MAIGNRTSVLAIYLGSAIVAVGAFLWLPWWTVDDAFISYRYAANLVDAGELTWNVGEQPVEGYTGILLPMLSALMLWLGLPMVDAIKILGIAAWLLSFWFQDRAMRRLQVEAPVRAYAATALALAPIMYLHSISGLETIFFALSLTIAYAALTRLEESAAGLMPVLALAGSLLFAAACRPEGMALAGLGGIAWLLHRRKYAVAGPSWPLWALAAVLVAYWTWRWWYYASWLPNTFYAKAFHGWVNPDSVWALAKFCGYYLALPMGCAWVLAGRAFWQRLRRQPTANIVLLAFMAICMLTYFHSHLWMNYGSRFFLPFLPVLLAMIAGWAKPKPAPFTASRRLGFAILLTFQFVVMGWRFHQEGLWLAYYHPIVQEELIPVGKMLSEQLPPGARVISYMDAGAISYYSRLPITDFGRLNDADLAREGWSPQEVKAYFFQQNADAVVMSSSQVDQIDYTDEAMEIVRDPRFHQQFLLAMVRSNSAKYPYFQHVFFRYHPAPEEAPFH